MKTCSCAGIACMAALMCGVLYKVESQTGRQSASRTSVQPHTAQQSTSGPRPRTSTAPNSKGTPIVPSASKASVRAKESFYLLPPQKVTGLTAGLKPIPTSPSAQQAVMQNFAGRLVYYLDLNRAGQNAIITQDIPPREKAGSATTTSLVYQGHVPKEYADEDGDRAYDPLLSPDGRYVLLSVGRPQTIAAYRLCVLDTQTNKLMTIYPKLLANPFYSWSPDAKYVAFIEGGDHQGGPYLLGDYIGPLSLIVLNWRTGEKHIVANSNDFGDSYVCSWANDNLIYSLDEPDGVVSPENPAQQKALAAAHPKIERPNIYEYSPQTRKSRLVVRDGSRPIVSPDGQWIAFYGSEDPKKPVPHAPNPDFSHGETLSVVRRDSTARKPLNREPLLYAEVAWLPDSTQFVTLQQTAESPKPTGEVKVWDIKRSTFRTVATIPLRDYKTVDEFYPRFHLLGVLRDGKSVMVNTFEHKGYILKENYYDVTQVLLLVDLEQGTYWPYALANSNVGNWSWREQKP